MKMIKTAYNIKMQLDVPDSEKREAEKALESFEELNGKLKLASNHLNIFSESFSTLASVDADEVTKHRIVLRNYRDQAKKNFEDTIEIAHKATVLMGIFSADSKTIEVMNSFLSQMKDMEKQFNKFLALFASISNANFINSVLVQIDIVKKQITEVKQLVTDRIMNHIETNILAKKWTNDVVDENENRPYEKLPLIVELYKERQEAMKG
jgi:hypothetical protein